MDLGIAGKRAVVAASSSGLGLGAAQALAAEGCQVVMSGRDPERLAAAAAAVPGAIQVVADVSTPEGATQFIDDARAALGGIDILVTNAGGPPIGTFASTDVDAYPDALNLNLMSVVAMCKAAVPEMQERGWGRVVAITSTSVRTNMPNIILSNTARAGATAFLKTLAREVAADGVVVNSVQPGLHMTPRIAEVYAGNADGLADDIPAKKVGKPEDFGAIVAFMCSTWTEYVIGASVPVDGGIDAGLQ